MIEGNQNRIVKELWGVVSDEISAERKRIIQNELEEAIRGVKIGMDNLSENLIQSLMSSADTTRSGGSTIKKRDMTKVVVSCFEKPIKHKDIGQIITDLMAGNNVYLYGRAGTGKTFMAKNIATVMLGIPSEVLNCSQWTSPIQIIGGQTIEGYQQGSMIKAWREGKILILDELPKLDPNTAGLLNDALAQSADQLKPCQIYFDGKLEIGTVVKQGEVLITEDGSQALDLRPIQQKVFCVSEENIKFWYFVEKGVLVRIETLKGGDSAPITKVPDKIESGQIVFFAPTIKDGKGDLSPKHPDFHVIGTGNTDMKDTGGTSYGGNNRQDYSLVDRFSGSYYLIEYDDETERALTYPKVFEVSSILRNFLDGVGAIESISLRTMLNFNRIYEQEMLSKIESELALPIDGKKVKTLKQSVNSFIDAINPKSTGEKLRADTDIVSKLNERENIGEFIQRFWNFHGEQNPITGEVISKEKLDELVRDFS
jgi:hypothetical protein